MYIWELDRWPNFRWDDARLAAPLGEAHRKEGMLLGSMARLGFDMKQRAEIEAITEETLKSSEIEGETLNRDSVRSSVARHLGMPDGGLQPDDRAVEGIVEVMLDATKNYDAPLTAERLFSWHAAMFPTGRSGLRRIKVGAWRDGPIGVFSGPYGREKAHFEGPPAERLEREMAAFLKWFEAPRQVDGIIHAAISHLWFVTIHPFDDGNGRMARALADMSLARSERSPHRFYSLASQIRRERPGYYATLEQTQKGDLDITERLLWFTSCFSSAVDASAEACRAVLFKADFWQNHALTPLNERQRKALNRLMDGFEGKLTAPKWAALTKCSLATAQRDIKELIDRDILVRNPGGSKNSSYRMANEEQ